MEETGRLIQARSYLDEAEKTLDVARMARKKGYWAVCVKDAFDAMEQAVSALIAAKDEKIPKKHTGKIAFFTGLYKPDDVIKKSLLYWAGKRDRSRYVDYRDGKYVAPSDFFHEDDAHRIISDAEMILSYTRKHSKTWID